MKAIAVIPKQKDSVHLVEMDKPSLSEIKNGRGVLVEVLRVGACGTDREINSGEYGVSKNCKKEILLLLRFAARAVRAFTIKSASRILRLTINITSAEFHAFTVIWRSFMPKAQTF